MDKRGGGGRYHDFPSKSFCLTVPKYFIGEHFGVPENFFNRKFSCIGGGHHGFVEIFLSHRTETKSFVKEPFCFPKNFWYRKKFLDKRGHITIFSRNFYVSQCRKISWVNPTVFQKISGFEKFYGWKSGVSRFSVEKFWSQSAEKFRGQPFNVSENLGYRKILCIIGGITFFLRKFLVSECRKISWAALQCFRKFGVSKNFMHNRGYNVFPSKIFGLRVPKNFVGSPSMFQKFWDIEKFYG